jgi:hypothetical protein
LLVVQAAIEPQTINERLYIVATLSLVSHPTQ